MNVVQVSTSRQGGTRPHFSAKAARPKNSAEGIARVIACVTNRNRFQSYIRTLGVPTPKTVPVLRGAPIPEHLTYPVMMKVASGAKPSVHCTSRSALKDAVRKIKEDWQVQEYLLGFNFYVLRAGHGDEPTLTLKQGSDKEVNMEHVTRQVQGTCRTLIGALTSLGVPVFELTVAVRQQTVYVISCRPNYVETH